MILPMSVLHRPLPDDPLCPLPEDRSRNSDRGAAFTRSDLRVLSIRATQAVIESSRSRMSPDTSTHGLLIALYRLISGPVRVAWRFDLWQGRSTTPS